MRFLHTADWQIGMKAVHVQGAAQRVRDERLAAGKRVVQVAMDNGAEFMLVAGDTFEDNAIDRLLVQKVADILAGFPGQVYVLPGNHDPLAPGSVWEHPAWISHQNLHVIRAPQPIQLPGGVLFPCPLLEKYSTRNPTRDIAAHDCREVAIGLAHGTLADIAVNDDNYPIPSNAAQQAGIDYLALGHWHSYLPIDGGDGVVRLAYSGTHETTKFGERASGSALLVEIESRGAAPKLTPIRTGGLEWEQATEVLASAGQLERLRNRIERHEKPGSTLLEVRISGLLSPGDLAELGRIEELLAARFLYGRLDRAGLVAAPEDDSWLAEVPPGVVQETARRLKGKIDTPESAVATQALLDLYRLVQEAR